jgi:hypothetical protein
MSDIWRSFFTGGLRISSSFLRIFYIFYIFLKKFKFKLQNSPILEFGPGRFRRISSNFIKIRRICEPWSSPEHDRTNKANSWFVMGCRFSFNSSTNTAGIRIPCSGIVIFLAIILRSNRVPL